MKLRPTIVIDTREQWPWEFPNLPTEPGTCAGDGRAIVSPDRDAVLARLAAMGIPFPKVEDGGDAPAPTRL